MQGPSPLTISRLSVCLLLIVSPLTIFFPSATASGACTDESVLSLEDHHIHVQTRRAHLWSEANGYPGLQTTDCLWGDVPIAADVHEQELPPKDLGIIGLCNYLVYHQCL